MKRRWNVGDWVRVKATGLVFQVRDFSVMDGLEDYPTIPNPKRGQPGEVINIRFDPDELEEANALDRLARAL